MNNKNRGFEMFVIIFVVLTGAGFGVLTGLVYSESYWWVAMMAGAVSGYLLAKLYLKQLTKISARKLSRKKVWLLSTLVAIGCGVICTTLVHGIMILLIVCCADIKQTDGVWPIFLMFGELVGACAGLIAGGICSLIYVLSVKGKSNETA